MLIREETQANVETPARQIVPPLKISKKKPSAWVAPQVSQDQQRHQPKAITTSKPKRKHKKQQGLPDARHIKTRSYRHIVEPGVTVLDTIELKMTVTKARLNQKGPSYYQGPWHISTNHKIVARGNLMVFKKSEIMRELSRQVQFFLHA